MPDDPLLSLIAETLMVDPGQVNEDSRVNQTENWDSLRNMMIMMEVERVFEIKISFRNYLDVGTVKDIRALIAKTERTLD
jgi:acyl carrier protein